jgi:diacylglycerol kinase family enzyme
MLLAFANAPAYGGGMRIAPKAQLDDGKLDFCLVKQVGKLRLSWLFPTVYFGRHLKIPEVEYFQAERVRLETGSPMDVYADGEFVCRTPVEVTVAPRALRVILPGLQGSGFWRPRREAAPGN